jgi:hypothetical protein
MVGKTAMLQAHFIPELTTEADPKAIQWKRKPGEGPLECMCKEKGCYCIFNALFHAQNVPGWFLCNSCFSRIGCTPLPRVSRLRKPSFSLFTLPMKNHVWGVALDTEKTRDFSWCQRYP